MAGCRNFKGITVEIGGNIDEQVLSPRTTQSNRFCMGGTEGRFLGPIFKSRETELRAHQSVQPHRSKFLITVISTTSPRMVIFTSSATLRSTDCS